MKQSVDIVELVNKLIYKAIDKHASDIHIEPSQDQVRVRFRIDGVLIDQDTLSLDIYPQIVARLKVMAHMNSTQKRVPQDGKFCLPVNNRSVDIRLSTFPSVYGEKLVIRILDSLFHTVQLENLGFSKAMLQQFKELVERNQGFFLVTGPTGSGKTTTLYAALSFLHSPECNIVTLEDPVEYSLPGITQAQINNEVGFSFAEGFRSVLRQDPDIIMIGEVRDKETARTAIEAAMTGHLVLSTLHTNDAVSAIMRLMDMGIEPYLINASLSGVLAQRLVRKLCEECKKSATAPCEYQALLQKLNVTETNFFMPVGCQACDYIGYKGRIGVFELLPISSTLRTHISKQPCIDTLHAQAHQEGMRTLLEDAKSKLQQGIISLRELARIIF